MDGKNHRLESTFQPAENGFEYQVKKEEGAWNGSVFIPWNVIGRHSEGLYRINFFHIHTRNLPSCPDWVSTKDNCDFISWQQIVSGAIPAFHLPKSFGKLKVDFRVNPINFNT